MQDWSNVNQLSNIKLATAYDIEPTHESQFVWIRQPNGVGGVVPQGGIADKLVFDGGHRVMLINLFDLGREGFIRAFPSHFEILS